MDNGLQYLNDLTWAYRASRVLLTANRFNIFTELAHGPMTCTQLAKACNAKPDILDKLLIACTAMGLLEKDGDNYRNSKLSNSYLVKGAQLYQGDIIAHSHMVCGIWDSLDEQLSAEPLPPDTEAQTNHNFIMGMRNITRAGRGQFFADSIDLTGRKNMLDIGGGPATYSILACQKYPQLKATVFDLPETIAIAKEAIKEESMSDRVSTRQGSWDDDDYGNGYDVVLMSNILHGQSSDAKMKLTKAHRCLTEGGLLVIQEFLLNDTKTGPKIPALFNIMVGAYSETELITVIEQAGFTNAQIVSRNEELASTWLTAVK